MDIEIARKAIEEDGRRLILSQCGEKAQAAYEKNPTMVFSPPFSLPERTFWPVRLGVIITKMTGTNFIHEGAHFVPGPKPLGRFFGTKYDCVVAFKAYKKYTKLIMRMSEHGHTPLSMVYEFGAIFSTVQRSTRDDCRSVMSRFSKANVGMYYALKAEEDAKKSKR